MPEAVPPPIPEDDPLAGLEDRILRTAELVRSLRAECDEAIVARGVALKERDASRDAAREAIAQADALRREMESLQTERNQVRARIEKLLGQMDQL